MTYETVRWEESEGVGRITLDRPDSLNAWTEQLGDELLGILTGGAAARGARLRRVAGPPNLPKPAVGDAKLQNYVNDLYKGTTNPNRTGTGTTADAAGAQRATGQATTGKLHIQKAQETARGLSHGLRQNPGAPPQDRRVAQSLYDELIDALGPHR